MNKAILCALNYLNELEVHGERNCVLLVSAIKELKPLQTMRFVPETADPIETVKKEEETK